MSSLIINLFFFYFIYYSMSKFKKTLNFAPTEDKVKKYINNVSDSNYHKNTNNVNKVIDPYKDYSKKTEEEIKFDDKLINNMIKEKMYKQEMYINLLTRFIEERCEYSYMKCINHKFFKQAFINFLMDISQEIENLNCSFIMATPKDICSIDNRFLFNRKYSCSFCDSRHFVGCCNKFQRNKRKSCYYIINIKLKDEYKNTIFKRDKNGIFDIDVDAFDGNKRNFDFDEKMKGKKII